jgi:uncharacterized protein
MPDAILESAISKVLQSDLVQDEIEFVWHAGEPLTAGVPFYQHAFDLMRRYNTRGLKVTNSIQTNGTLISEQWSELFKVYEVGVGLSVDGPEFLHDRQRMNWGGRGSHRETMRGFTILQRYGIVPGAICVLTRESLRYPEKLFAFFLEAGFRQIAFNLEEVENAHPQSSLAVNTIAERMELIREYRSFISRLYELWRPHSRGMVIREFDNMFTFFKRKLRDPAYSRRPLETTGLGILTIQKNGNMTTFSPEFAGGTSREYGNFIVGNVADDSLESILKHPVYLQMQNGVDEGVHRCEQSCMYFALCGGGFTSNKYFENGNLETTETITCTLHRQTLASTLLDKLSRSHSTD